MAERKSTLGALRSSISEAFQKMDERANARQIKTPSGEQDIAAETLVALSGLMAGIWGGNSALAMVKPGFDAKSVFMKGGVKTGLAGMVQMSDKIMNDIIKNDKHILSKKGGEEILKTINNIDKNLAKHFKFTNKTYNDVIARRLKNIDNDLDKIEKLIKEISNKDFELKDTNKILQECSKEIIEKLESKSDKLELQITSNDADSLAEVLDKVSDPSYDMETFGEFIKGLQNLSQIKNLPAVDSDIVKITESIHKLIDVIPEDINGDKIELAIGNMFNAIEHSLQKGVDDLQETNIDTKKILQPFYDLFDAVAEVNKHQVVLDIEPFLESLEKLTKDLGYDKVKTAPIHKNIKDIIRILKDVDKDGQKNTLSELFENIHKVVGEGGKVGQDTMVLTQLLKSIMEFLKTEINPRNAIHAKQGISVLVEIFDSKKGQIKKLFKYIEDLQGENKVNISNALDNLTKIFNAIAGVATISPMKMMGMKFNISFLEAFMMKDILKIMKEIGKLDDNVAEKDAHLAIENLTELFDAVTKLGEIDSQKRTRMFTNLKFIKMFLMNDLLKLMEEIAESGMGTWGKKEITKDTVVEVLNARSQAVQNASIAIGNINALFDTLIKVGEIDPKSRNRMNRNFKFLKRIIEKDIKELIDNISAIELQKAMDKSQQMSQLLTDFTATFENLPSLLSLVKNFIKLEVIKEQALLYGIFVKRINALKITKKTKQNWQDLNTILTTIANIKPGFVKAKDIAKTINELNKAAEKMALIGKMEKAIEAADKAFKVIVNTVKETIKKLNQIKKESIERATNTLNAFANLVIKSAAILIFGAIVSLVIAPVKLITFTVCLGLFVMGIIGAYGWASKYLKDSMDSARGITLIVMAAGATLLLGGLFMKIINPGDLILFTVTLGAFIMGITGVLGLVGKRLQESGDTLYNFALLVLASGAVMILGGMFMKFISIGDLALFAVTLGVFMWLTTLAIASVSPMLKDSLAGLRDFTVLVAVSGTIMIAAAILGQKIPFFALLGFAFNLGLFIFATLMALAGARYLGMAMFQGQDPFKESALALRDFAILVLASGAVMFLASFIADKVSMGKLFLFAVNLGVFVLLTTGAYALTSRFIEGAIDDAKQFGLLLLFSAAVMIFGGMFFTWFPEIITGTFLFAAILGGFMMAVGLGIMLASKFIEKGQKTIFEMTLLVVLSGALMLFAGWVMTKHPGIKDNIWQFVLCDLVLIGGVSLIVFGLSKIQSGIWQGVAALGAIILITGLSAYVMGMVGDFSKKTDWKDLMNGIGKIDTALLALGFSYWTFGYLFFLDGGLGLGFALLALTVINGLTLMTAHTMTKVMNAMKYYDEKKMDRFKLVIEKFGEIGKKMASEFTGWWVLKLPFVTGAIMSLGIALSVIARAVKEYAELKVPVYEGTKVTGYRELKDKDFNSAAKNVSKIITTLGGAVISTYERNPEIFEADTKILGFPVGQSKFAKVAKSLACLGPMLSKIAEGVKEYADMKIPLYEGTKKIGYRHLEDADFQAAATNVKHIIEVLGKAVIDTYDENPEIFEEPLIFGSSKFSKVCKSLSKLGPMIATIAKGVKDYADLKVGEDYKQDKNGFLTPTKYRHLNDDDFVNAAINVKHIISVLGGAIVDVYSEHPDYYEESGGFLGFGGSSPFSRTIKANMKLANLISKIAKSVKDYADMKIGEDYKPNKDGFLMPTKYRHLEDKDFTDAARNIKTIITTLGGAIIEVYEAHPDYYETSGGFLGFGGSSPFSKTIEANMKLGNLISKIAVAVKDYANFKVGEDYQKDSKTGLLLPTKYRHLDKKDFKAAAENVKHIITVLGGAIIDVYKDPKNKDMFDNTGLFGTGDSPFAKTIKANMKMAELIDTIGKSVKELASSNIAIKWDDKTGKPIAYEKLDSKHFKAAADNIKLIITTLGQSIMKTYKDHEDWFDDGEDSVFAQACTAIGTMGNMIANIAQGIQAYADLKVPIYGEGGKITKYEQITDQTFKSAAKNIGQLVATLGKTVIEIYNEHEDWFDDGPESDFAMACTAIGTMGDMLGKISTGLQSYAELKFPIKWDKDGNPTDFKVLQESDFDNAAKHIRSVVSTMGETIMKVYNDNPKMFEVDPEKHPDSTFAIVVEGCSAMGEMISSIAEGIQAYADLKMPTGFDKNGKPTGWKQLDESVFGKAATNIGTIITTIGGAIDKTFYEHRDWFEHKVLKKAGGFLGMQTVEEPDPNDPPFIAAVSGCTMMGAMISSIAKGIQDYANLDMPLYDASGKIIGRQKLDDGVFTAAATNIGTIITLLGGTIEEVYKKNWVLFVGDNAKKMTKACTEMGKMISAIAKGIQAYANLSYPIKWNDKGIATEYQKLTDAEIEEAGKTIAKVLTTVGNAVAKVADDDMFSSYNMKKIQNMLNAMQKTGSTVTTLAKTVKAFATMTFTDIDLKDPKNPKIKFVRLSNSEITGAIENIGLVLKTVGKAIIDTVDGNEEIFGKNILESPAYMAAMAVGKMGEALNIIARSIGYYSKSQFPKLEYKDGKLTTNGYYKLGQKDYDAAKFNIKQVVLALGEALSGAYNAHTELFELDAQNKKSIAQKVVEGIKIMAESVKIATDSVGEVAKIDITDVQNKLTGIENSLSSNLKTIVSMYGILTSVSAGSQGFTFGGVRYKIISNKVIGEWMHDHESQLTHITDAISRFAETLISIAESLKTIPDASKFNDKKLENIQPKFEAALKCLNNMAAPILSASVLTKINSEQLFDDVEVLKQFIDELKIIIDQSSDLKDEKALDTLSSIIDKYITLISKLKQVFNGEGKNDTIDTPFGMVAITKTTKELEEQVKFFGDNIERIIDLSELSKEIGSEGLDHVSSGVQKIDEVMTNIHGLENFQKHNAQMDAYVNTVNKLQVQKVDKLTNLVKAMITLSNKMGNVDQLTEAIADRLSTVLDKLVNEMQTAEKIIKESETIQKRRHDMIEKSVKNVKEIMTQKLLVEVMQIQDNTNLNTPTEDNGGGTTPSTTTSGGTTSQQGVPPTTNGTTPQSGGETTTKPKGTVTPVDRNTPTGNRGGNGGGIGNTAQIEKLLKDIAGALATAKNNIYQVQVIK